MASKEQREAAIRRASEQVANDRSGFLSRAPRLTRRSREGKAAVALMEAISALRYIEGQDVPGMEGHQRPEDVAAAALGRIEEMFPGGEQPPRDALATFEGEEETRG